MVLILMQLAKMWYEGDLDNGEENGRIKHTEVNK